MYLILEFRFLIYIFLVTHRKKLSFSLLPNKISKYVLNVYCIYLIHNINKFRKEVQLFKTQGELVLVRNVMCMG